MAESNNTLTAQVRSLKEGESVARSVRVPVEDIEPKSITKRLTKMRNSMNQISSNVKSETGYAYRVESGSFVTADNTAVVACVTITCLEDDGEDDI